MYYIWFLFQFTHPRGVRSWAAVLSATYKVSIHAPARGAIDIDCVITYNVEVSIHAPARGAIRSRTKPRITHSFNSRTREGCDYYFVCKDFQAQFQFTHPRGVRFSALSKQINLRQFQFTHPRGVRFPYVQHASEAWSFNSRTREGCDPRNGTL